MTEINTYVIDDNWHFRWSLACRRVSLKLCVNMTDCLICNKMGTKWTFVICGSVQRRRVSAAAAAAAQERWLHWRGDWICDHGNDGGGKRAVSEGGDWGGGGGDEDATACAEVKGGMKLHQWCERRKLHAMKARLSGSDAAHSHRHSELH